MNNWLKNSSLDFLHDFTDVGSNLLDLSQNISNYRFLNCTIYLFNSHFFNFNLHDSLNFLDNLNNLLDVSVDRNDLLDDTIYRYWNFNRDDRRLFNFNHFFNFYNFGYYSLNFDFARYLNPSFDNFFWFLLYNLYHLISLLNRDYLLYEFLNDSINFVVDVLDTLNLDYSILNNGNLNKFLDFSDLFKFNYSVDNFFYDLRYFYNLFNNSRNNYNLFDNLLNFNYLGHFNHLFHDLINSNSNFFNSLDSSWYLHDLLNNDFDWVILSYEVIDVLLNFNDLVDLYNSIHVSNHFYDFRHLSSLYYNLSCDLRYSHNFLLDYWYFNSPINNLLHFLYQRDWVVYNPFYLFYSVSINDLLFNYFDFLNSWDFNLYLNDLLDSFGYFNYPLNYLDYRNWLLDNNFDNFRHIDYLIDSFYCTSPLYDFNWFLDNTVERLYNLHYLFYNFLFDYFHFYNFSDYSLNRYNLLSDYLHFLDLRNSMVDYLFYNHRFLDFYNLFLDHLDYNYFWYLNYSLHDLFYDSGYFHYFFSVLRYLYHFFNDIIHNFDDLDWHMNDFLNFLDFDHFN